MTADSLKQRLLAHLRPIGQEHLLAFWDQLDEGQRQQLARQIEAIDPDVFREVQEQHRRDAASGAGDKSHWARLAAAAQSPPAMRLDGSGAAFSQDDARRRGAERLRAGKLGMILVAGGLGTRLGFDQPKGMFPIGPLSGRTLFQVLIEQLLAVGERHGISIPLDIMTSPATDDATRAFLREHQNFGLPDQDLHVFCQATMWAVDSDFERILLESPDSLFLGPDGHGGMLSAFARSGGLSDARRRSME